MFYSRYPDKCIDTLYPQSDPITGLPFFMVILHSERGGFVPTYGGPFDSYTIPQREKGEEGRKGSCTRERYDHDLGVWTDTELIDIQDYIK